MQQEEPQTCSGKAKLDFIEGLTAEQSFEGVRISPWARCDRRCDLNGEITRRRAES